MGLHQFVVDSILRSVNDVSSGAPEGLLSGLHDMVADSTTEARNPCGTLSPFLGSGFPYIMYQQKKGYPYRNMVTATLDPKP